MQEPISLDGFEPIEETYLEGGLRIEIYGQSKGGLLLALTPEPGGAWTFLEDLSAPALGELLIGDLQEKAQALEAEFAQELGDDQDEAPCS